MRGAGILLAVLPLAGAPTLAPATVDTGLPQYKPSAVRVVAASPFVSPDGRVRIVGYNDMRALLEPLTARFTATHPGVRFELELPGTRFAPQALATETSALAPMGARFTRKQLELFRRYQPHDPACFPIAHASLNAKALSGPLAVFVNTGNPLHSLSMRQVQQLFSGDLRRWGQLGLGGAWRDKPIELYGLEQGTVLHEEFAADVMQGRELAAGLHGLPQSTEVVADIRSHDGAVGFAAAMRVVPGTRRLALTSRSGGEPIELTPDNVASGRYPLDRYLYLCAVQPIPAVAREFILLALSREGQGAVAATPQRYIPLSAAQAAVQRQRLCGSSGDGSCAVAHSVSGK